MSETTRHPYPAHREADVALRDGSTVHVRAARSADIDAVKAFLASLSSESKYFRFFANVKEIDGPARTAVDVDYGDRYSLLATAGPNGDVVGHAIYLKSGEGRSEVAFAVADTYQGRGLGTILLAHLAQAATEAGISIFEARVLAENHRMIQVFRDSGFPVTMRSEPGEIVVEFPTELSAEALERFEQREQTSAVASVRSFLSPSSVAVIGASPVRGTIGGELFHNVLATGFTGPVYPVNPNAEVVQSVPAYRSVLDVPGPVDLALIIVPAPQVAAVVQECGQKGVRAVVVVSSGFAELGQEGRERQRELVGLCRRFGMRLVGPNCMGVINTDPDVRLNATFGPAFPPHGRVAFSSQSGALGLVVIDHANALGLGISSFVSVGNKADISGNDLIQYWETDPGTDVILLYLESFGNPRRFARITRRVSRTKPIVAVKSGRSIAGTRATSSHTGALISASDVTVDALFQQAGVIRTDTLAELFDVAALLANQPTPAGRRVGIVTNAGGLGVLCADACEGYGLVVPAFDDPMRRVLAGILPAEASVGNPVDIIESASAEDYREVIRLIAAADSVDAIIVLFVPPLGTRSEDVAAAIRGATSEMPPTIPLVTVFMSAHGMPGEPQSIEARIPSYRFPEDAARALARAARYGTWRSRPEGQAPSIAGVRSDEAAALIAASLAQGVTWLHPDAVAKLFSCYGLPLAERRLAESPERAAAAAAELGGVVALKAVGHSNGHRSDVGGVRLSLSGPIEIEQAATEMSREMAEHGQEVEGYLVQRMIPSGVEMLIGMVHDPQFGPVLACGAGGVTAEILRDVAVRITPLTDVDVDEMVRSLRSYPLLLGYRGSASVDVGALLDVLLRVSTMVEGHPEIAEMDCDPVMVLREGAVIIDARVRVEPAQPPRPLAARTI